MKTFDLDSTIKHKKIVAYGAGEALASIRKVSEISISYIVDDAPDLQGQFVDNILIRSPNKLLAENKDHLFVIVCVTNPSLIFKMQLSLKRMGLNMGQYYLDCSFFHYNSIKRKLKDRFG